MSTPFLAAFAESVVVRLLAAQRVSIGRAGTDVPAPVDRVALDRAVLFVANWLGTARPGTSLLTSLESALLACPEVNELYADVEELKSLVDDLR